MSTTLQNNFGSATGLNVRNYFRLCAAAMLFTQFQEKIKTETEVKFWKCRLLSSERVCCCTDEADRQWLRTGWKQQPWQTGSEGAAMWQSGQRLPVRREAGLTVWHQHMKKRRRTTRWFTDLTVWHTHCPLTDTPTNVPAPGGPDILWRIKIKPWHFEQIYLFTDQSFLWWCLVLRGVFKPALFSPVESDSG